MNIAASAKSILAGVLPTALVIICQQEDQELTTSIRKAQLRDCDAIAGLMRQLGYGTSSAVITGKLHEFERGNCDGAFVAVDDQHRVIGCISVHVHALFHAEGCLGRITSLVVHNDARRSGVGTALVEAAERFFEAAGCIRVEVTSGEQRLHAHQFYLAAGFVEDERRFVKKLCGSETIAGRTVSP